MDKRIVSALDLFKKYHDRYPRIEMSGIGFSRSITDAGRFYLQPVRDGKPFGHMTRQLGYPYVDVIRASLDIVASIRGSSGADPHAQLQEAYWKCIREDFLEGRRFFVRVCAGPLLPRYYDLPLTVQPMFPARFRIWPALKKGMVINPEGQGPRGYLHWSAFVPEGTPEYDAIRASLDVAERIKESPLKLPAAEIKRLHELFFEKLARVD